MELLLPGPVGDLEAHLALPPDGAEPRAACAVGHAHPLYGGTMNTTAVYRLAKGLQLAGVAALRIHFRGVGASAGAHHGEGGEEEDLVAALDELERRYPGLERWLAGFSFGARTAGALAVREERARRFVLVAPPVKVFDCAFLREIAPPGLLVSASEDEFGTGTDLRERFPELPTGIETLEVQGSDHFFSRKSKELQEIVRAYADRALES